MKPATRLLRWYRNQGRKLPWRNTRDPYRILVSELMLQQTQVSRVLTFYAAWLKRFPNWKSLADATNAEVIHAWAGLGYNRRAIMLRDIARHVALKGEPKTEAEWLALKGVGPYTAAAVTMFAHRRRAVPIDTNIRRTVGRLFLGVPYPQPDQDKDIQVAFAEHLLSSRDFFDTPQALFDLATKHCTKKPSCADCPMRTVCEAADDFLEGKVQTPKRMTPKSAERIHNGKSHPDRIYRGRILTFVRTHGSTPIKQLGPQIDPTFNEKQDAVWVINMVERLEKDGLLNVRRGRCSLPHEQNDLQ